MTAREPIRKANRPLRILIVEDNADGREMLRLLLEMVGHDVEVAEDGERGLEKALKDHPQVAVVDIGLPRLDGYQVAQQLRSALGRTIFLITQTSHGLPEDRQKALEAGFDFHLTKPVDPRELCSLLDAVASSGRV